MALVESDLELYTTFMTPKDDLEEFYEVFKAQVATINTHGGKAGLHPTLRQQHLKTLLDAIGVASLDEVSDPEQRKQIGDKATKLSCEEYLA
ncbi:hypothetical protein ACHAXR_005720 [Thalassiosira sp. AJA248-18]